MTAPTLTPRLTVAAARMLVSSCDTYGHRVYPYGQGERRLATGLEKAGLVRITLDVTDGRETRVARATPFGRWRALGGRRP